MSAREIIANRLARIGEKRSAPVSADAATSSPARQALRVAHASLASAERNHEGARSATRRARSLLEAIVRESEALDERERREAEATKERIREAVMSGGAPAFDRDVAKTSDLRSELDGRRSAAERVHAELRAEEATAEEALGAANRAVEAAARAVMADEARAIAARWVAVEEEARSLRSLLGRFHGPVERMDIGTSESNLWRALDLNSREHVNSANLELHRAVNETWVSLSASLARDPEATPDFAEVDRIREARLSERAKDRADFKASNIRALAGAQS